VIVREQDLGRAIRDEEGRIFYVVEDPDHGRYAARTRKGSAKDLERYRALQSKLGKLDDSAAVQASRSAQVYDATGTRRRNPKGILLLLIVLAAVVGGAYVYLMHPEWLGLGTKASDAPAPSDADPATSPTSMHRPQTHVVAYVAPAEPKLDAQASTQITKPPQSRVNLPALATPKHLQIKANSRYTTPPADMGQDPSPVIVPTRTWNPTPAQLAVVQEVFVSTEAPQQSSYADFRHTASGLRYKITHTSDGPPAQAGNFIHIRYTAKTLKGQPLIDDAQQSFVLMSGEAIRAFDEGLAGVREGEQLSMLVPRGHSENGHLPGLARIPDEPFLLDVQVVSVKPGVSFIVERQGKIDDDTAMPGDTVSVHYVIRVEGREQVVDSTSLRGEPMKFTLGQSQVIPGLEQGILGMRRGETRLLSVPPYLAYGDSEVAGGLIPSKAVLSFRVMLVDIDRPADGF